MKKLLSSLYRHIIRPIKKWNRRRHYLAQVEIMRKAKGEIVESLEPLFMKILNEALADYHEARQQNYYTVQASHDIKRFYHIKLKSFISINK